MYDRLQGRRRYQTVSRSRSIACGLHELRFLSFAFATKTNMGCGASTAAPPKDDGAPKVVTAPDPAKQAIMLPASAGGDPFEKVDPRVADAFRLMDKNGDNELSKTEILIALRKKAEVRELLGLDAVRFAEGAEKDAFEAAFEKMDTDASSMISPKELDAFLKGPLMASAGPPALEQSLQKAIAAWGRSVFEQFDTDKNGVLDKKELGRALKALPKTKPTMAPPNAKFMSVEEMIEAMDADNSGGVDVDEWQQNLAKCAGLAAALAESVNDSGVVEKFRSFEQQKAKREKEIAELESKLVTASPEEMERLTQEMQEYERQVESLAKKIEEAAANAAARAAA